jgi:formate dehydrogenase maturation protein FdhE
MGKKNQQMIKALTEAGARSLELASFYELYQRIFQLQHQVQAQIAATLEMVDDKALQARMQQGLPLLSFAQLPLEVETFAKLVSTMAQLLTDYNADLKGQAAPNNPADCLALAQQRFEEKQSAERDEATLAQLAVDLALKPYLKWAAEQALPYVDQEHWKRGHCPVCGGAPDFSTLDEETGARLLLCSRCDSEWLYRRLGCPFCGTTNHTSLMYYPSEDGVYRLYVCQECQRYLKTIDLRKATRVVLPPVERVTTVAMDAAAREEGYW